MDSDSITPGLHAAFAEMQRQVEAAHSAWIATLAEHCPEVADQLWALHSRTSDKNQRLQALLLLFATNPALPIEAMLREYSANLDAPTGNERTGEENTDGLDPRQRAARTKRRRSRERLLEAAVQLITEGDTAGDFMAKVAQRAGLGAATVYNHFVSKDELIRTAYGRLLEPVLQTTTDERN